MPTTIRRLTTPTDAEIVGLTEVLIDSVESGASVSFMAPLSHEKATAFWRGVGEAAAKGECALLVAEDEEGISGTVHLNFALPENQPHRAEVAKMLVHRRARGAGVGAALLVAAEATAKESGKTLLVLDTVTNEAAERLYTRGGWTRVGVIPSYALYPDGVACAATIFYKKL
jgi:GNAT superfamily N-acetyltransferase